MAKNKIACGMLNKIFSRGHPIAYDITWPQGKKNLLKSNAFQEMLCLFYT